MVSSLMTYKKLSNCNIKGKHIIFILVLFLFILISLQLATAGATILSYI